MRQAFLVAVMALCMLSACTSLPPVPAGVHPQPWHNGPGWFSSTCSPWGFSGKLGVRYHHHGTVALIEWEQQISSWDLDLSGPLNQNPIHVHGEKDRVQLQDASGRIWEAPEPDSLIQRVSGAKLPVSSLLDWLKGRPHRAGAQIWRDADQNLAGMIDAPYQILYSQYHPEGQVNVPHRIEIFGPHLHLTLIVRVWTLSSQC